MVHYKLHQERPIGPATGVTPTVPSHPQGWEMWFRRLDEATGRLSWASQKEFFMTRHDYPATGAWDPSQPVGSRHFAHFPVDRPFALDGGTQFCCVMHGQVTAMQLVLPKTGIRRLVGGRE